MVWVVPFSAIRKDQDNSEMIIAPLDVDDSVELCPDLALSWRIVSIELGELQVSSELLWHMR